MMFNTKIKGWNELDGDTVLSVADNEVIKNEEAAPVKANRLDMRV
jgi:hypothetical protein